MKCDAVLLPFSFLFSSPFPSLSPRPTPSRFASFQSTQSSESTPCIDTFQNARFIRGGHIAEEIRKKSVPFRRFTLKCEWLIDSTGLGEGRHFLKGLVTLTLNGGVFLSRPSVFEQVAFPVFLTQFLASFPLHTPPSPPSPRTGVISVLLPYLLDPQGKSPSRVLGYSS